MKKHIVKTISLILSSILLSTSIVGCSKNKIKEDDFLKNYSYGIEETGYYKNLSKYKEKLPDFKSVSITYDEVLTWGMKQMNETEDANFEKIDDYVYRYGKELLSTFGLADKETAEVGDIVNAKLEFYLDDKKLDDYTSTQNYEVDKDGDSIVKSFIGKTVKTGEYEVDYKFGESDGEHNGKTAKVKVKINSITMQDPISAGMVEANLEKVKEALPNVTDTQTFLTEIRPKLAESTLDMYLEEYLRNLEFDVPEEYVEYEFGRFQYRLTQIQYTYKKYLKEANVSDDEIKLYCKMVARQNYLSMLICQDAKIEISDKDVDSYYGQSKENMESVQGLAYMKMNMIRTYAVNQLVKDVKLVESVEQSE